MKRMFVFNLLAIAAMLLTLTGTPQVSVQADQGEVFQDNLRRGVQYVPGELVVGFAPGRSTQFYQAEASALASEKGGNAVRFAGNTALLSFDPNADVVELTRQLMSQPGVQFVEPNYVFSIPEDANPQSEKSSAPKYVIRQTHGERGELTNMVIPVDALMAMRKSNNSIQTVYPNDPYLWWNVGWGSVGADIVWPNATASATVCVIDTGVDYQHPDLAGRVIKGKDFVNDDLDPMDDNGHGTHVAGIIAANRNNAQGMAGVSTGPVLAVKVLTAQGIGTTFDIASGITYCANSTAKVINLSLGGSGYSQYLEQAVYYATVTKGKLIVAAAGNNGVASYCSQWVDGLNGNPIDNNIQDDDPNTVAYDGEWQEAGDDRGYPAGFSSEAHWTNWYNPDYWNLPDYHQTSPDDAKYASLCERWDENGDTDFNNDIMHPGYPVFAVASQGIWQPGDDNDGDGNPDWWWVDNTCKSDFSNYGEWVNATAPGLDILSTTPWDKAFHMNVWGGVPTRYANFSGTSMASPFVAATVARDWGYHPLFTQSQILNDIWNKSWMVSDYDDDGLDNNSGCWPESMDAENGNYAIRTNVAVLLERGAFSSSAFDASTALPLTGGAFQVYQGTALRGSAVFGSSTQKTDYWDPDLNRKYMWFESGTDILNLPAWNPLAGDCQFYTPKISKAGYTATPQNAFLQNNHGGTVPLCPGWWKYGGRATVPPLSTSFDVVTGWWNYIFEGSPGFGPDPDSWQTDLDSNVWLPDTNVSIPTAPPFKFAVGPEGWDYSGQREGETLGALTAFPFARWKRDGGVAWAEENPLTTRFEDITIKSRPGFPLLPYYGGNYGSNFYAVAITDYGQSWDHDADGGATTPKVPLLGLYRVPWVYVWRGGQIVGFTDLNWDYVANTGRDFTDPAYTCNEHWWRPLDIISPATGTFSIKYYDGVAAAGHAPLLCGDVNPDKNWNTNDGIEPYSHFKTVKPSKP